MEHWSPGLWQLLGPRSAQAGYCPQHTHTHTHSSGLVALFLACLRLLEEDRGGGQCAAASAAHEYSGCKLLQLFLSSNQGKLLSLLPSSPPSSCFIMSQQIWPSSHKRWLPSCKGKRTRAERGIIEMVIWGWRSSKIKGQMACFAAQTQQ